MGRFWRTTMKTMLFAAALLALVVGGGCKSKTPEQATGPQCSKDADCGEGKACRDGRCVVSAAVEEAMAPCDRAMANVKRLNEGQGKAAIDIDLADLRRSCATWPQIHVTCLAEAKDLDAMRVCTRAIMKFEVDRVKAAKGGQAEAAPAPVAKPDGAAPAPDAKPSTVPTEANPSEAPSGTQPKTP
jgi:hypothetical protein